MPVELNSELDRLGVAREVDLQATLDAANGALASGNVYADTPAGLAATTNGQYFSVPSAASAEYLILYKNNAGVAQEVKRYPAISLVDEALKTVRPIAADALYRTAHGGDLTVANKSGRILLQILRYTKQLRVPGGLLLDVAGDSYRTAPNADIRWAIAYQNGRTALAFDSQGRAIFSPAPLALDAIRNALNASAYVAPGDFSADRYYTNIRPLSGFSAASRQDSDGVVYEVVARDASPAGMKMIAHNAPIRAAFWIGQSNAGDGGETGVIMSDAAYPDSVFAFSKSDGNMAEEAYGTAAADPALWVDFAPAKNRTGASTGQMPPIMGGFAVEAAQRARDRVAQPGRFVFTSWYGGQPINTFIKGTTAYNNLLSAATKQKALATDLYGRASTCDFISFCQGENAQVTGDYATLLESIITDLPADVQAIYGQAALPRFIFQQINLADNASTPNGNELAQLAVARAHESSSSVVLMGPRYQYPFPVGGTDFIHSSPLGRMMEADTLAYVLDRLDRDGYYSPLWPVSAVLSGSDIIVTLNRSALSIDADWVASVTNAGFVYKDSTSSATVTSAEITGPGQITVHLSNAPSGADRKIEYAMYTADTTTDAWANGRGLIYAPSTFPSYYASLGFAVPATVREYLCRFSMTI